MKKTPIKHRIIRAGTITVLGGGLSLILGIGVRMVIARVYGPEGMGEYAGFMMFLSLFGTIAAFSLPRAVLKLTAEYEEKNQLEKARTLFSSIFIFLTISCLLVAIAASFFTPSLGKLIQVQTSRTLVLLLGLTLILASYSVLASTLFLGLLQNLRAFAISISSMIAMLFLAGYVYFIKPFPVYFLLVAGYLVSALFGIILSRRQGLLVLVFSREEIKKAFLFVLPLILISYLQFFVQWFDRFTLGMYFGVKEMGLFSAGLVLFSAARRLPLSLTEVLIPSYSKISLQGKEVMSRAYNKNICFYAIIFFFITCFLTLYRKELILILFTKEFMPAANVLLILGWSFVLSVITNPGSSLLIGCGYTKLNSINYAVSVAVLIPALLILTRRWGLPGAAAARVLAHVVSTIGMLFILTKLVKLKISFLPLFKLLAYALSVGVVVGIIKHFIPLIVFNLPLLLILYFGGVWGLILSQEDKEYLKEIWLKLKTGKQMLREPNVEWDKE